ncbi:MAG: DNA-binding response regulator [Planctomycetes bacterium]|jgi:two-component system copper resistance phosphate regulon response regulator CusR|nr:DNA-binding response regulator [Planctomycetota bacterium]
MRLLVVDDDPKFRGFMLEGLKEHGFSCTVVSDVPQAEGVISRGEEYDLILLDVMMPKQLGWEFLEWLRSGGNRTPVIFVTARHAVDERVKGLKLGADDYIVKPFEFSELLARLEAVSRRHRDNAKLEIADLVIDFERRLVERSGRRIEMSPREYDLLLALVKARGKVIGRDELLRKVWDIDFDPGTNVVNVQVARLRRKIDLPGHTALIHTVVGKGYVFSENPVEESTR